MKLGRAAIVVAFFLVPLAGSFAQSPWPDSPAPPPQQSPWPNTPGQAPPAQTPWPAGPTAGPGFGPPGGGFGPPQQQQQGQACMTQFLPLRQEAEKRAQAIAAASKRKAPREEICKLLTVFVVAEEKVVKFVRANSTRCGIPADVAPQMRANHEKAVKAKVQVCSNGPGTPAAPSLSDALNGPIPSADNTRTGRGTFDTLTGNPIK